MFHEHLQQWIPFTANKGFFFGEENRSHAQRCKSCGFFVGPIGFFRFMSSEQNLHWNLLIFFHQHFWSSPSSERKIPLHYWIALPKDPSTFSTVGVLYGKTALVWLRSPWKLQHWSKAAMFFFFFLKCLAKGRFDNIYGIYLLLKSKCIIM